MQMVSYSIKEWFDRIAESNTLFYRLVSAPAKAFKHSRFLVHITGKLRRFALIHFRKEYVQHQLFVRRGECRRCGACCNLLFRCPLLTKEGCCMAYGVFRPQNCKVFPVDQRDIQEVETCGGTCGYNFIKSISKNPIWKDGV